jgi:hypothetical protein
MALKATLQPRDLFFTYSARPHKNVSLELFCRVSNGVVASSSGTLLEGTDGHHRRPGLQVNCRGSC